MSKAKRSIILTALLVLLTSCGQMSDFSFFNWGSGQYNWRHKQAHAPLPQGCFQRAAYAAGVADAKAKRTMQMDYGQDCPREQSSLRLVYRQGYENGALARTGRSVKHPRWYTNGKKQSTRQHQRYDEKKREAPVKKTKLNPYNPTKWHCFADAGGAKVCGYYCQRASGQVKCTSSKHQRCVKNEKGDMACGYNCTTTAKGVKCAPTPEEKCLSDVYGNIQCGDECYRKEGQVICD